MNSERSEVEQDLKHRPLNDFQVLEVSHSSRNDCLIRFSVAVSKARDPYSGKI